MRRLFVLTMMILCANTYSQTNNRVENSIGGLRVGIDKVDSAIKRLGHNYYKFAADGPRLVTYVWYDISKKYYIEIQLATVDSTANDIINTITVSSQMPQKLQQNNNNTYLSKISLLSLKTTKGVCLSDSYSKLLSAYGKPVFIDDNKHFKFPKNISQCRYIDTTKTMEGVFTVQYDRRTKKLSKLEVHYVDW